MDNKHQLGSILEVNTEASSSSSSIPLFPKVEFNRKELEEIIEEIPTSEEIKSKVKKYLDTLSKKVETINRYQTKAQPENFIPSMKSEILKISNTAEELFELLKHHDPSLSNALKGLILKWINPLEKELKKREIPKKERNDLELKTKYLYAEQSFLVRTPNLKESLTEYLESVNKLFQKDGEAQLRCYISYAWPSEAHESHEYWVQPFLVTMYKHLSAAGIRMIMDVQDNKPGNNIYLFMKRYHEGNPIILIGTESLLEKHYSKRTHAVQTELSIILDRSQLEQEQNGQSLIYPMLISGFAKNAYPEIYDKYKTVRDGRKEGYIGAIKELLDWLYEREIKKNAHKYEKLWKSFNQKIKRLSYDLGEIEKEIDLGYHRKHLGSLTQKTEYKSLKAQQEIKHSSAVSAKMTGILLESHGSNPSTLFDEHGEQFQRPTTNPDFIFRKALQSKIENHFKNADQQILTLTAHGLGGVGKTELAQYFYLHPPQPYSLRAWFEGSSRESIYQQYLNLGVASGIQYKKEMPLEEKVHRIKEWLESQKDCLLIYDNVFDIKTIENLLPQKGKHHILLTSRNEVDWPDHQKLDVDIMEEDEAIALIRKITGIKENDENLKKLATLLGRLPLALAQAGAYIAVKKMSIEDYLKLYRNNKERQANFLKEVTRRSPKHEPVWVTFDLNFEALGENCPNALKTLQQASWLSDSAIPEPLLEKMLDSSIEDKVSEWLDIKENISLYSLMKIDVERHQLNIHPLVQDILRYRQSPKEQIVFFRSVSEIVDALIKVGLESGSLDYGKILPHAERLKEHGKDLANQSVGLLGEGHAALLGTLPSRLGLLYEDLGEYERGIKFYKYVLKIKEKYCDANSLEISDALGNLGNFYGNLCDESKKIDLLSRALLIQKKYYGEKSNPDIATTFMNLGNAYSRLRRFPKAEQHYQEGLETAKRFYSEFDIKIDPFYHNLGAMYGMWMEKSPDKLILAKDMLEKSYKIKKAAYPNNSPALIDILLNLGNVYSLLGEGNPEKILESNKKAKTYYEKALKIQEKCFNDKHPKLINILTNIAVSEGKLNNKLEQERCLMSALKVAEHFYEFDNINMEATLLGLGDLYLSKDFLDLDKAKMHYKRLLKIQETHYGEEHIEVANTLYNLGGIYNQLKKYAQRDKFLKKAKPIYQENYPNGHPQLRAIEKVLAALPDKSPVALSSSSGLPVSNLLEIQSLHNTKEDKLDFFLKLSQEAKNFSQNKKYDQALYFYELALKTIKSCFIQHINVAHAEYNVGTAYICLNAFEKSQPHLKTSIELYAQLLGPDHPHVEKAKRRLRICEDKIHQVSSVGSNELQGAVAASHSLPLEAKASNQNLLFSDAENYRETSNPPYQSKKKKASKNDY